jgi:hypothetical protein
LFGEVRGVIETLRVEFEPLIDERVRQFIINGIDYYSIAATGLPNYLPINFPTAAMYSAGCLASSGEAGCR